MEIKREMFIDSVATNQVQFRRHPNLGSRPDSDPGLGLHQVTLTTGNAAAANANTTFFLADCSLYEITIKKVG